MASPTASVLGEIGLPAPVSQLASQPWDAIPQAVQAARAQTQAAFTVA